MNVQTIAFKMQLKPGMKDEYKRRHQEIWPGLVLLLKESHISNYSIFLDEETDTLFASQTIVGSGTSQQLGENEIVKKWWAYMADIMITNSDSSPVTTSLEMMFHLA